MILCICEKPSVARDIGAVIGATLQKQGYLEGAGYWVTWTYGHFCTLKEPSDYFAHWRQWSLVHLPMIPDRFGIKVMNDTGIQQQFGVIKDLVSKATEVINCGDAGQEGELIQRWVLQMAGCTIPVKRLWLSSMTNAAIQEAFLQLKPETEYTNLYYAGLARAIGDWLLGINATRLYTLKYRTAGDRRVLSVGRVQTPTLALIVNRDEEIKGFTPQPYWEIKTLYKEVVFASTRGKYATEAEAQEVIADIASKDITISKISKRKGKEAAPRLFDLTSLQIEANKRYALTAEETLNIIQTLYEGKLVTYPRVDTTYLPDDIYPNCLGIIKSLSQAFPTPCMPLLGGHKLRKLSKYFDSSKVTDHHAIIPTGNLPQMLDERHFNIYQLIMLRFLAIFYPDMEYEQTTVLAKVDKHEFKATGRVITHEGWRVLYPKQDNTTDENDGDEEATKQTMPSFEVNEHGPHTPSLLPKETRPPKQYTEATLLNAMETAGKLVDNDELREAMKSKGIGRPSTRSAIIEVLFKRGYIERKGKSILPTSLGTELIHTIHNEQLKSVELTGEWEYKLRQIDKGEYNPSQFLDELKGMVSQLVTEVISDRS